MLIDVILFVLVFGLIINWFLIMENLCEFWVDVLIVFELMIFDRLMYCFDYILFLMVWGIWILSLLEMFIKGFLFEVDRGIDGVMEGSGIVVCLLVVGLLIGSWCFWFWGWVDINWIVVCVGLFGFVWVWVVVVVGLRVLRVGCVFGLVYGDLFFFLDFNIF